MSLPGVQFDLAHESDDFVHQIDPSVGEAGDLASKALAPFAPEVVQWSQCQQNGQPKKTVATDKEVEDPEADGSQCGRNQHVTDAVRNLPE